MGLTRPRAHQFSNSDYKLSCRALQASNVTLSGGAPATVDGVSISLNDRILVTGQTAGAENGIYRVQTVGTGSNGTWVRDRDANTDANVTSGLTVTVTSGTVYDDTQWKLTTDDPITLGTTALTFEQASAYAFGQISADGTTLTADAVNDLLTVSAGTNISISGDAGTDTMTISLDANPSVTTVTASGNIAAANVNVSDVLRIDQTASGLRMTNVGAFDNDGSDNFRIFATNDLSIGANGETGNAVYIDTSNNVTVNNALTATGNITGGNLITTGTVEVDRLALTSTQTTVSPLQLTASNLQDGVGALRIEGAQADIFLNPATATHTTVTFAVNDDQRAAFGMDDNSDFYITRRTGGSWYDDTLVIDRDTGDVALGYTLTATGNVTAGNLTTAGAVEATGNVTISGDLDLNDADSQIIHGDTNYNSKEYVLYGSTTDATETEIFVGGTSSSRIPVASNTTIFYQVYIVARRTDTTGESAGIHLKGVVDNFSGTVADVGDVYEVIVARDDANYQVDARADDTNDALSIHVTGVASKTISWTAIVKTYEVAQ